MNKVRRALGGLSFIAFAGAIGCLVAYALIGAELASDGTLIEPFFLVPMAWLFLLIGFVSALAYWGMRISQRMRASGTREDAARH